jgi:uncharacterized protein YydD (DUF2326 family)
MNGRKDIKKLGGEMRQLNEIDNERDEKQKELKQALTNRGLVEQEKIRLQREILKLRVEKKEIEDKLSKANQLVQELRIDISQLTNEFWQTKNL